MRPGERVCPTAPVMSHSSKRSGKKMELTRVIANPNYAGWEGGRGKLLDITLPNLADNVTLLRHADDPYPGSGPIPSPYPATPREIPRTLLTPFNPTA